MSEAEEASRSAKLPVRPRPKPGETFASWVIRIAIANGTSVRGLVQFAWKKYSADAAQHGLPNLKLNPGSFVLVNHLENRLYLVLLSLLTGIPEDDLDASRLCSQNYLYAAHLLTPDGSYGRKKSEAPFQTATRQSESFCPACLAEDFYLRRTWRTAFLPLCTAHTRTLLDECPKCHAGLGFYRHGSPAIHAPRPGTCECIQCGFDLGTAPKGEITPQALDLHRFLAALIEGTLGFDRPSQDKKVIGIVHRLMDALLHAQTRANTSAPGSLRQPRRKSYVAAYVRASCAARGRLFTALCNLVQKLRRDVPELDAQESAGWSLLSEKEKLMAIRFARRLYPTFTGQTHGPLKGRRLP